ncbi:MAG: sigma 54-interacting transcriptional regulator [Planctomycetes bacterium]|nr:sigma 54-interacting transcriptional regulator [Planctomycetota bacterium]
MPTRRLLFSWIGYADLRALAATLDEPERAEVLKGVNPSSPTPGKPGPIKCLLNKEKFDEIHLLTDHSAFKNRLFVKWLGVDAVLHSVKLKDPTNYPEVFAVVDAEVASVVSVPRTDRLNLCMHLSPGTPTMTAIWLFLGKSKYPATFFQAHEGNAGETSVPFDLVVDFIPQVLRDADARLQRLASQSPKEIEGFESIIGESRNLRVAVGSAQRAAKRDVSVLILGESGTGKEKFAKAIHDASPRSRKSFVSINCAAISTELLESELFGHKKGAFTSAIADRDGAFKEADGGTLFLDELGECDPAMQAKLLRVLQPPDTDPCHRVFYRVGDSKPITSDVRIIAATNRNLLQAISRNEFRDDLYYRVAAITIKLPPLRERREDIPLLVPELLNRINQQFEKREPGFQHKRISNSAMAFVRKYPWPGNVRQLYNTLLQAAVMTDGEVMDRQDIADAIAEVPGKPTVDLMEQPLGEGFVLTEFLEEIQRHYLLRGMKEAGGVKTRAAELLGYKSYQTLAAQLDRLNIESPGT